jgi:hypothetical protein
MDRATREAILRLAGIPATDLAQAPGLGEWGCLNRSAGCLEGLPLDVIANVARAVSVGPGTLELIQTLKTMGYRIALACRAFECVAGILCAKLGIDHCFGVPLTENDDAMTLTGELEEGALEKLSLPALTRRLAKLEGVEREEITIIASDPTDADAPLPGIRLVFDMKLILDYHNQHILSRQALIGLLGGFGPTVATSYDPMAGAETSGEGRNLPRGETPR